jgi:HlyD family secretion protein
VTRRALFTASLVAVFAACDSADNNTRIVGQLESDRVEISAESTEPLTSKLVTEGQPVRAGDGLMQQDTARVDTRIAEASAALGQTKARLDELIRGPRREQIVAAKAGVQGAERELLFRARELERATNLLERELVSPSERDRANAQWEAAQAAKDSQSARLEELLAGTTIEELEQAERALEQADARLSSLTLDRERHRILAPVDGIVDSILFEPGERPLPGQPLIIMLTGPQPYARVYVPEHMRAAISPGDSARIFVDGIAQAFAGRVRWVSSEAAFTPYFALTQHDRGRLCYLAKVDLRDGGTRLPDGVPVEVEIERGGN